MRARSVLFTMFLVTLPGFLPAQQNLESAYRMTGSEMVLAFEEQRQVLQSSSAVMLSGRKEVAYGVVISRDGYLLTKASEVEAVKELSATVDRQNYPARILSVDRGWDVALVKIEANGLAPVVFSEKSDIAQGTWVVANGATSRTTRRLLPGVISAKIREIPPSGGVGLGVVFKGDGESLEIEEVREKSGAKEAGLQKGDLILSVEDKKLTKADDLLEFLKDKKAGNVVKITYRRKKEEATAEVKLSAKNELFQDDENRNDQMSGDVSTRRSGFPRVIQHDILGNKSIIGGPLLTLDGKCVGMNIARANRAESFAIPAEDLRKISRNLMAAKGAKPEP